MVIAERSTVFTEQEKLIQLSSLTKKNKYDRDTWEQVTIIEENQI